MLLNAGGETGSVERLDLVLESRDPAVTRTGEVQLCWAGAAEPWSAERCAHLAHGELAAGGSRHYRFALGTHPAWRREASKLAVTVVPPVVDEVALCAVNGFAEELRPERLAELAAGGFQTVLDGQIRYALPAVPDLPIERDLEVPRDAELRFAYAVPAGLRAAITFRVSARAGAKPASELFRAPVAEEEDRGRWHEARVDLGPWAGERITLRLETSAEAGLEVQHGLPLWGNPEVLAP